MSRLAQQAYDHAWVFGANFVFIQRVTGLERKHDGLFVALSDSGRVRPFTGPFIGPMS